MFACAAVVDRIARMATYATTPDAVRNLLTAIAIITSGPDASVKSTLACASIVDAIVRMSTYATTQECVSSLASALGNIVHRADASETSMFASAAVGIVDSSYCLVNAVRNRTHATSYPIEALTKVGQYLSCNI
ncbi:Hypothetical protein, putative [Bodo saltans]|uniref:Uncharacterized protein n=1 Tax=Bodo saltans TaxID=75058 RepID=A0A0S4J262_BODSA|nr:Hypothetical protein, putative [Bodo saltans]|eukprot:CUG55974.1 Hypothetical protein, putative [Bodo saltans]